jgi:hypothetical protein
MLERLRRRLLDTPIGSQVNIRCIGACRPFCHSEFTHEWRNRIVGKTYPLTAKC